MKIGMPLAYSGGFTEAVRGLADYEKAGLDVVFVAEAYTFDAVSRLGYIAASTQRLGIASGVIQLYTRTPTLIAMTGRARLRVRRPLSWTNSLTAQRLSARCRGCASGSPPSRKPVSRP